MARRLGYRSNVATAWESGRSFPLASRFLWANQRLGVDVRAALAQFYRVPPKWLATSDVTTSEGIQLFLGDLCEGCSILEIADRANRSRFAVSRWLSGKTQPRLPDFLALIEASSFRLLDFVSCFIDPAKLDSVARDWGELQATRRAAYEVPWSHAVLRVLETEAYACLSEDKPGWIAAQLRIEPEEEATSLRALERAQQIRRVGHKWAINEERTVDLRYDPAGARRLRIFWAQEGARRAASGADGVFAYNLFSVSRADLHRLRELQQSYYTQFRAIVAESEPSECVALANMQIIDLAPGLTAEE